MQMRKPTRNGKDYWILLGMLSGLAIALLTPIYPSVEHRPGPLWKAQVFASNIFWSCWIGAAIGLIVDLIRMRPHKRVRFQFSLRSLFLFVALVASALGGWTLYIQIMTMAR